VPEKHGLLFIRNFIMPEIDDKFEITVDAGGVNLQTNVNGDVITIRGHLTQEQAAILSWLINGASSLKIKIKEE
jgi:hypothetical protein